MIVQGLVQIFRLHTLKELSRLLASANRKIQRFILKTASPNLSVNSNPNFQKDRSITKKGTLN